LPALNLGTRDGASVQEVITAVEGVMGRAVPITYGARRHGDPPILIADASRARELLGWTPRRSTLEQMVGSAWEWRRRFPDGYGTNTRG
jgi:UDP-glucose 4-epimerase